MRVLDSLLGRSGRQRSNAAQTRLDVEHLEAREVPAVTSQSLVAGVLTINGSANNDHIEVRRDLGANQLVVFDQNQEVNRVASAAVTTIVLNGFAGSDILVVDKDVLQNAMYNVTPAAAQA